MSAEDAKPKISKRMASRVEVWPVEKLIPYARNARTHSDEQVAQIAASIIEFGFCNPILVDTNCGIIAGHGRLMAARKVHLTEVPVIVLDHLSETQRKAYILADNRLALSAGWDQEMLRLELQELQEEDFNLDLLGFSEDELNFALDLDAPQDGLTDEDQVPEEQTRIVSAPGDLWLLGGHRLLCGDATDIAAVDLLMAKQKADLVFTDPPYNVDYEGYTKDALKIQNDAMDPEEFKDFLSATFGVYRASVKTGASMYVCHASSVQREFQDAIEAAGFTIRCQIIWAKNTFAWGHGRYKYQHEPLFYCYVNGERDAWYGDKSQSTLWAEKKPAANRLHPTMKPVELIERALRNSSKAGDIVLDLFGGSGSTLIACERLDRSARLTELDPRYCDVIVRRWQEYTGEKALLETGEEFDAVAAAREAPDVAPSEEAA